MAPPPPPKLRSKLKLPSHLGAEVLVAHQIAHKSDAALCHARVRRGGDGLPWRMLLALQPRACAGLSEARAQHRADDLLSVGGCMAAE